jgi:hypothetical protein
MACALLEPELRGARPSGPRAGSLPDQEPVPTAASAGLPGANPVTHRVARLSEFVLLEAFDDALSEHVAAGNFTMLVAVHMYMAALAVADFDMLRRRVQVRRSVTEVKGKLEWSTPKTHERRSVPFPRFLTDDLARRMAGKGRDDLVFGAPGGGVLRIATFRTRVFNPAVAKLRGIDEDGKPTTDWPRPTMHDLRHTAASLSISAGANVKAVLDDVGTQVGGADSGYLCRPVPR